MEGARQGPHLPSLASRTCPNALVVAARAPPNTTSHSRHAFVYSDRTLENAGYRWVMIEQP